MLVTRARDNAVYVGFCNLVGGQDELVFDGHSVVLDDEGEVIARAPGFEEALLVVDLDPTEAIGRRLRDVRRRELERAPDRVAGRDDGPPRLAARFAGAHVPPPSLRSRPSWSRCASASAWASATTSRRTASATSWSPCPAASTRRVTAAIAADALGADRVHTVSMPSRYSSEGTRDDAREVSENLGVAFREIPIEGVVTALDDALGGLEGLAAENLQARIRGTLLMALSNTHGWLVLATGNKSEMAVGYATLYGDMVGGYALLKDVFKTDVFRLARHLNDRAGRELVPVSTIERPPTAELRAEQRDDQSLPPYDELDPRARGVRRARPLARGAARAVRSRRRRADARARRPGRIQAPPGGARGQAPSTRVRPRLADADHEPLARLKASSAVRCPLVPGFSQVPLCAGAMSPPGVRLEVGHLLVIIGPRATV